MINNVLLLAIVVPYTMILGLCDGIDTVSVGPCDGIGALQF